MNPHQQTEQILNAFMAAPFLFAALCLAFVAGRRVAASCRLVVRRIRHAVAWWRDRQARLQRMRIYVASMGSGRAD